MGTESASPTLRARSLGDFVKEHKQGRRVPVQGSLETTFRCNLACAHCYVNKPADDAAERASELSLERLKQLIDELVAEGCLELLLTGGEVLVRPDFEELYLYAQSKGLLLVIFTNGTLVTTRVADFFAAHKPYRVEISLYGMTPETYERVTGVPGSFDKCIAGIKRLVERGVHLKLKTMVLSWNMHEVEAMRAFAASLGLEFKFDGLLNPRVDCGANRNGELQIDPEMLLALDLQDEQRMAQFREHCERFVKPQGAKPPREQVYTCGAGESSFNVDPQGNLQLCLLSRKNAFDLKRGTFAQGWHGLFPKLRARTWQSNAVCRSCSLLPLCSSCPGAAEMETGSPEGLVPAFCRATHLRAWAILKEKSGHRQDGSCCLGAQEEAPQASKSACCGGGCGKGSSA